MNHKAILEQARYYVQKELEHDASGHDWWHIVRVTRIAKLLAEVEQASLFVCELAALLHDIADEKLAGSKELGLQKVQDWLLLNGVEAREADAVMEIVSTMSFGGGGGKPMSTLEGQIVQDADRLDAIGAIGIARTFVYAGSKGTLIYDPALKFRKEMTAEQYRTDKSTAINHYYEKLLKLKSRMNTEAAKLLAEERHRVMESYLTAFDQEWALGNEDYLQESLMSTNRPSRIHVTFGESAAGSLRQALKGHLGDDRIICLSDDLMVGPLHGADDPAGLTKRLEWWRVLLNGHEGHPELKKSANGSQEAMNEWKKSLNTTMEYLLEDALAWLQWSPRLQEVPLVIWASDSPSEQTGLRRLLAALPQHSNILHVNATIMMPRSDQKAVYLDTGEIMPDKLATLLTEAKRLLPEVHAAYVAEWQQLLASGGTLRIWSNGQLQQVDEDYFDETIMQAIRQLTAQSGEMIRCARVVGEVIGHAGMRTSDTYIEFRIRQLILQGKLIYSGELYSMRSYSVNLA
ncbi:MAG: DUF1835 domain-containing protein [Gorillibacterium sp.]|nr:DUF1835 domain-containing protein [Gorillibacterium sp.]